MKPGLHISTSQQLVMTPQLKQALHFLQLSSTELEAELVAAVESNPLLEWKEGVDTADTEGAPAQSVTDADDPADASADTWEGAADDGLLDDGWRSGGSNNDDEDWQGGDTVAADEDLHDHLLWQLHLSHLQPRDLAICAAIVEAIDDDGYLRADDEALRAALQPEIVVDDGELRAGLCRVQQLDPVGVGARDLRECLCLQLRALPEDTPGRALALRIAAEHLDHLPKTPLDKLARQLDARQDDVEDAVGLLRRLDPRPGAAFAPTPTDTYITPDCAIWRQGGVWKVGLLGALAQRVGIQADYARMAATTKGSDGVYLRGQLQEARWLLRNLESRGTTLLGILRCVVREQAAFLEFGPQALRPLTLRQVAAMVGVHESTVSRAVARKYVRTPTGTLALRDFFASGVASEDGESTSSTAIQSMIRTLIAAENPRKPLSDAALCAQIQAQGVPVARRTVAKYREALDIPPSHARVRLT